LFHYSRELSNRGKAFEAPFRGQKQNQVLWAWMVYFCAPGAVMEPSFLVRSMQDEIAFISYEV